MTTKYIHKEGRKIIINLFLILAIINFLVWEVLNWSVYHCVIISTFSLGFFAFVTWFFRNPFREIITDENLIIAPADGKVVVLEEVEVDEYFADKRLQVSIFMSPTNVHVNRSPIKGEVKYSKYHPGRYLVAWHPKSSEENERTSIVVDNGNFEVMFRQIAGKVARRIVNNLEEGDMVEQGWDFGFIKFGSRMDIFLPIDTKIKVKLGDKVKGGETILGELIEEPEFFF
ncbi:MAG: phosphatidylserine decarboxylase family protein [Bacteroidetes bacterium]|nr:phosphatidylserine decarboxylase family protein [Bacteroidota bacterium]